MCHKQGWKVLYEFTSCKQSSLPPARLFGEKFTHFANIIKCTQDFCQGLYSEDTAAYRFHGCVAVYTVEPLLSGLRLTVNSNNRASHWYAVPLRFQCMSRVVSG
jgi:hypothetical protein